MSEVLGPEEFRDLLLARTPIIDVRAPVEFAQGSIPGSVNLPILSDDERSAVGITYKQKGQAEAIRLGHELVSGDVKMARVAAWRDFVDQHPSAVLTCYRGGMRSKISQQWLSEAGFTRPRIQGGYKELRTFFVKALARASEKNFVALAGHTGSGKTKLLSRVSRASIDLENLANHRGSAFGGNSLPQPSQADFENRLALKLLEIDSPGPIWVEDESRMIGNCAQPEEFFGNLRKSPVVVVDEPLEVRALEIFEEYVPQSSSDQRWSSFDKYKRALTIISRKLGGARYQEILHDLSVAYADPNRSFEKHQQWIKKLLLWYYDPLYEASFQKRQPKILFKGTRVEVLSFILSN